MDWIREVKRGLLADGPGLGKSRVAVEAFDGQDVLVVAPAMVIQGGTWETEIAKWASHPERFTVVPFTSLCARHKTRGSGSRPVKAIRPEYDRQYDAVVVDEAHYVKGRGTTWTWAVQKLAARSESFLAMTGTPVPNWAHEIFTLCQAIRPLDARRGGELGSYHRWLARWFRTEPNRYNPRAVDVVGLLECSPACDDRPASDPCEHWTRFVDANLPGGFLRRLRSQVLDLPPVTWQTVNTPMVPSQARAYRSMRKDYLAEIDGSEVVSWTQGAKNVALDKLTVSESCVVPGATPGAKLVQLEADLAERQYPTVVFAHYRSTVLECARVAESLGRRVGVIHGGVSSGERSRVVAEFKAGRVDVLVGSLETLAEGLQLTRADMAIFVEVSYKPSRNEQARYRVDRLGQTRPVTIREYVTPKSVDARKRELLASKNDQQMRMLSARDFAALL